MSIVIRIAITTVAAVRYGGWGGGTFHPAELYRVVMRNVSRMGLKITSHHGGVAILF